MQIKITDREFDPRANYKKPIEDRAETDQWFKNLWSLIHNFDYHGFDLSRIERLYAKKNMFAVSAHRANHWFLQKDWFLEEGQETGSKKGIDNGPHINNAILLQRPAYQDEAMEQLKRFAQKCPLLYKLANMRPKWGLQFNVDYCDAQGNSFELISFNFSTSEYEAILKEKTKMESWLTSIDWIESSYKMLDQKSEWTNLDIAQQNNWKKTFFGLN